MLKFKKISSILLTCAMFAAFGCLNALAETPNMEMEAELGTTNYAVSSQRAATVPETILDVLSDHGAEIAEDTTIDVLRVNGSEDTAICVTNVAQEEVKKDIYLAITKDATGNMVVDNSMANVLAQGPDHDMSGSYPPLSWDGSYIVHATATAARYNNGIYRYYKPYKCSFYYENYAGVDVDSIEVRYIAEGVPYSYPGFEFLNRDNYEHMVTTYKSNPVAGVTYSNENYFPSNMVLSFASGFGVGQFLTFFNSVDGRLDTYTVNLLNSY